MIQNLAAGQMGMTSNAFLVPGERTVLVDTGAQFDIVSEIERHVEDLDAIVLTHTHPDHIGNLANAKEAFDVDVWGYDAEHDVVDHAIADGETVTIGDHSYEAIHTPGHKNDHLCLYSKDAGVLFAGDLVFANGGFGRTDLAEGDRELLIDSIQRLLDAVGPDLREMHAGHGPSVEKPHQDIQLALQAAQMQ